MNVSLSIDQIRALRLRAQRLDPREAVPGASAAQILAAVCGVQAQETPAAALALRVRSSGLLEGDVERARLQDRSVIRTWCQRGTLHLLALEDYDWLLPLLGPIFEAGSRSRHRELGLDEGTFTAGIRLMQNALAEHGPLTRAEIAGLLRKGGLPDEGQAPIHILQRAALQGILCQGPDKDGQPAFVLVEDWLGKEHAPKERLKKGAVLEQGAASARLSRRYLQAYGPAGPQDLSAWSGIPMSAARLGWELIASELVSVEIPGGQAWMLKERLAWLDDLRAEPAVPPAKPVVRLLPRFDTYLLGYASRDLALAPEHNRRIHPGGGIIHAALLVEGRALGRWSLKRRRDHMEVSVELFEELPEEFQPGLETEAEDLGRFLGNEIRLVGAVGQRPQRRS